jgi:hypothetical protein
MGPTAALHQLLELIAGEPWTRLRRRLWPTQERCAAGRAFTAAGGCHAAIASSRFSGEAVSSGCSRSI